MGQELLDDSLSLFGLEALRTTLAVIGDFPVNINDAYTVRPALVGRFRNAVHSVDKNGQRKFQFANTFGGENSPFADVLGQAYNLSRAKSRDRCPLTDWDALRRCTPGKTEFRPCTTRTSFPRSRPGTETEVPDLIGAEDKTDRLFAAKRSFNNSRVCCAYRQTCTGWYAETCIPYGFDYSNALTAWPVWITSGGSLTSGASCPHLETRLIVSRLPSSRGP